MKKTLGTLALALSLALGPVALAAAQDGGVAAVQPGGRGHGHHGGRHRGGHGRGMRGDPAQRAEHRARMLTAILDLDARQQAQVRAILTQSATEAQALHAQLRAAGGPPSEEARAAMEAHRQRTEQRIDAVLSASQRATIARVRAVREQDMQERRARREQHRAEPGARQPAAPRTR